MEFRELNIERAKYGPDKGKLRGTLRVSGDNCEMQVGMSEERAKAVIDLCADLLVDEARDVARIVRDDVIEHHMPSSAIPKLD